MTTDGERVVVQQVTDADGGALAALSCRSWTEPWTAEIEATIHSLAQELGVLTAIKAKGVWLGEQLVAVAAWRKIPGHQWCQCLALAVQTGQRRKGFGRLLKGVVIDEARQAGCHVVISKVHWDNHAMLHLNCALGANIERIPGDEDYAHCIIPL